MEYSKDQKETAITYLKKTLKPGRTIYTDVKQVSRSGMSRHIKCYIVDGGKIQNITWHISRVLGYSIDRDDGGLKVSGCGMDMGFHVIYNLAYTLFPKGYKCPGESCRSNDHFNDHTITREKGKHKHSDGGYAFDQQWL